MLQIVTELDGFDPRGNIKVLMATNRPDTLDPALLRPGRLDRKVRPACDGYACRVFKLPKNVKPRQALHVRGIPEPRVVFVHPRQGRLWTEGQRLASRVFLDFWFP